MNIQLIPNQTVANLRQAGYKVKVLHERFTFGFENSGKPVPEYEMRQKKFVFAPKGGKTTVIVTSPQYESQYSGIALCSKQDSFNRKRGVQVALGRLHLL